MNPIPRPCEAGHFRRRISPNEWLYLAFDHASYPLALQFVVQGRGAISRAVLAESVRRASDACPGARLERRGRVWTDSGRPPAVREVDRLDESVWLAPLAPQAGGGCEVILSPGTATTLVFRVHHALMDGRGMLTWVLDIFRVLRGEEPIGARSASYDLGMLEELAEASTGLRRRPAQRPAWRSPLPGRSRSGAAGLEADRPHVAGVFWERRAIDGLFPGLTARVAAAVTDFGGHRARMAIPVDTRRHRPAVRSTANLALPIVLDGWPGQPWTEWYEQLLRSLDGNAELAAGEERFLARFPQSALRLLVRAADAATRTAGRRPCTALISHLGRVLPQQVSLAGFTADAAYALPVRAPFIPVSFTMLEFGRHTELAVAATEHPGNRSATASLLDAVCVALSPAHASGPLTARRGHQPLEPVTVTALFRQQVSRTPGATALTRPEGAVTYTELDRRSDVVAAELSARGVGRGDVVGLLADRSVAAIAGLLGVLKIGAAYLPLDPKHPARRIAALLADSAAALCLVSGPHEALAGNARPVLQLDLLPAGGAAPRPDRVSPDDAAYVMYTSGSTGGPKGVLVEHRALCGYQRWATGRYDIDGSTRSALFTSLAADLCGTALFLPLLAGGSIVLVPGEPDYPSLTGLLRSSGVNTLKLTPAHLDLIVSLAVETCGLRTVVVGGEQLSVALAQRAQLLFGPDCRIVNEYGPTEATIGCITHTFDPRHDGSRRVVPIGVPADGTDVYLLDEDGVPAPTGSAGEIHLAGVQLARGYLGCAELTSERFWQLADGTRVYRTGDLARLDDDGLLEFIGRTDSQISIRGNRIEPCEIEEVLQRHPGVTRAAVTVRMGRAAPLLCALVTSCADPEDLREHVAGLLPGPLVPDVIQTVGTFPLTISGKLDRRRLTVAIPGEPPDCEQAVTPSDDPLAKAVVGIWAAVLHLDGHRIGLENDFHRLGGDSLALLHMLGRVSRDLVEPEDQQAFRDHVLDRPGGVTVAGICAAIRPMSRSAAAATKE